MRHFALALLLAALPCGLAMAQEEKKVPKDSARISIPGCVKNRTFIVAETPEHEPVRSGVLPGRRFRLNGKKKLLNEIKKQQGTMVEVTGLVRQSDLAGPGGVNIGGVRIGGGPPRAPMGGGSSPRNEVTGYQEAVLDLESWRAIDGSCPSR